MQVKYNRVKIAIAHFFNIVLNVFNMSYRLKVDSTLLNSIKMMSKASTKSQNIEKKVFTLLIARTGV